MEGKTIKLQIVSGFLNAFTLLQWNTLLVGSVQYIDGSHIEKAGRNPVFSFVFWVPIQFGLEHTIPWW